MFEANYFCYIAARGQGKSFLIAIFCVLRCILFPGTKIVIAAGTRGQANNVLEKIKIELMPKSSELRREIKNIVISAQKSEVEFKNTSFIKVVTANDNARSARANIIVVDEFRMVKKSVIDAVLKKFVTAPRIPGYMEKPEYANRKDLIERNKEIYLSSAFFKNHWSYEKVKGYVRNMFDDKRKYFACGLPYQLSIYENLLDKNQVADEMSETGFSETTWSMEMECLWFGDAEGTFYDFESVAKNRKISKPMLPDNLSKKINDTDFRINQKGLHEKRLISIDVALAVSSKVKNDATAMHINQLIPTRNNRYINNIVYSITLEGMHTEDLAVLIRRLYEQYQCDYIVLDTKGVGFGVYDTLIRDITDPETGEVYPALSCCNNKEMAARCKAPNAEKKIWAIQASAKFNSDCAIGLRDGFKSGKIRLLVSEFDAQEIFANTKGFSSLTPSEKLQFELPYINTTLLINELINLKHDENNGLVRITERSGMRKDRYSSLAYNYWVACQLEASLAKQYNDAFDSDSNFIFRAPKQPKHSSIFYSGRK